MTDQQPAPTVESAEQFVSRWGPAHLCGPDGRGAMQRAMTELITQVRAQAPTGGHRHPSATYGCERCGRWDGMDTSVDHTVWAQIAATRSPEPWRLLCLWCMDEIANEIALPDNTPVRLYFPGLKLLSVLPEGDRLSQCDAQVRAQALEARIAELEADHEFQALKAGWMGPHLAKMLTEERDAALARVAELERECREIASLSLRHEARAQRAEDAFSRYGYHKYRCAVAKSSFYAVPTPVCDCGFDAVRFEDAQPADSGDGEPK